MNLPQRGEIEIDEQEIDGRKRFLEFRAEDAEALKSLGPIAQKYADPVIEDLYRHFLSFDETRAFFRDPQVLERVKRLQKEYFVQLTRGDYGADYVRNRLRIGTVHERIDLAPKWYLGAYSFYLRAVANRLLEAFGKDPRKAFSAFLSLMKLVFLDVGLAVHAYIAARESTMRKQQEAIRELSTPVLQIRDRLLLLPIIGVIDTHRARLITEGLLRSIRLNRARVVVMDVTGVATVDSKVAQHLLQTVAAARLMGASVIVTGLSSEVAQSLVALGIDLGTLNTVGDLQGGIEEAERLLGYRVIRATETGTGPQPAERS
ncbi:MAG: STAS domain-containing protein [Acidobacteria bacterium]|nr:STAS domain-containing protein [Acidobacteriota bacterium]